jgi:hypothetical protein
MLIFALDPGPTESGWVLYDSERRRVEDCGTQGNAALRAALHLWRASLGPGRPNLLAIEMIASYGMPVGAEVFDTCTQIGRFVEAWGGPCRLVFRRDVKLYLCGSPRAKDANIRQALLDRFGGKAAALGKKAAPGPLHGIAGHEWPALAVALTAAETKAAPDAAELQEATAR